MPFKKRAFFFAGLAALAALAYLVFRFRHMLIDILTPLALGSVIAYLLRPIVKKMENRGVPRNAGIIMSYLLFFLAVGSVVVFIIPELISNGKELMETVPEITARSQELLNGISSTVKSSSWPKDVKETIFAEIQSGVKAVEQSILAFFRTSLSRLLGAAGMFIDILLAMVIAYYLLRDAEKLKNGVLNAMPRKWRNGVANLGREVHLVLSRFIQGQFTAAAIVGLMEVIGLYLVKVKYPMILGLFGGIANIIPYFGPALGAIPAIAVAFIDSPVKALWTLAVFVAVQQIDNAIISPKIIQGKLGLHPVVTILAVLAGGKLFGIPGMIFSVPLAAILKVLINRAIEAIVRGRGQSGVR